MDNNTQIPDATLSLPSVQKDADQGSNSDSNPDTFDKLSTAAKMPQPVSAQRVTPETTNFTSSTSTQQVLTDSSALIAEDVDLIEKEWVERAKEIVHKTKDNPYLQNRALTQLKVDYVKKRYNKAVKMNE